MSARGSSHCMATHSACMLPVQTPCYLEARNKGQVCCLTCCTHRFPGLFSYGLVSHEGPTQEQMECTRTTLDLYACGYSQPPPPGVAAGKPDKQVSQGGGERGRLGVQMGSPAEVFVQGIQFRNCATSTCPNVFVPAMCYMPHHHYTKLVGHFQAA